jgi:TonB family protein
MNDDQNISQLFDHTGNLTLSAMERYLQGKLNAEERETVEIHLSSSPFEREAMEGLRSQLSHDIRKEVADLDTDILLAARKKWQLPEKPVLHRYYWAAAAGLVALVGLTVILVFQFRAPIVNQSAVGSRQSAVDSQQSAVSSRQSAVDSQQLEVEGYAMADQNKLEPDTRNPEPLAVGGQQSAVSSQQSAVDSQQSAVDSQQLEVEGYAMADQNKLEPDTRNPEPGTRNPEPGTRNPEPETRNPELTKEVGGIVLMEEAVTSKRTGSSRRNNDTEYYVQEMQMMDIPKDDTVTRGSDIFLVVESMPEFPGGEEALNNYFADSLQYPTAAVEKSIQGRVFVQFVIEMDGSVSNVRLLRGIGGGCDEEALRVVQAMPRWIPGKQRGQAVRVQYTMPIMFSL